MGSHNLASQIAGMPTADTAAFPGSVTVASALTTADLNVTDDQVVTDAQTITGLLTASGGISVAGSVAFTGATGTSEVHIVTNLADALSIEVAGVGDFLAVDTTTGAVVATLTTSGAGGLTLASHLTMGDAKNVILNATTGTKIGTATTQKLGFWNTAPVVQPVHIADPSGGATQDAESRTAIAAINAMLAATGLTASA